MDYFSLDRLKRECEFNTKSIDILNIKITELEEAREKIEEAREKMEATTKKAYKVIKEARKVGF